MSSDLLSKIENISRELKKKFSSDGIIHIITHLDTDGLTSGAILIKILKQYDQRFSITILKQLEDSIIDELEEKASKQKWKAVVFLDLGSNKLSKIRTLSKTVPVFVLDHHEMEDEFENIDNFNESFKNSFFVNAKKTDRISAAGLSYLLAKELGGDKKFAQLALLGMIGDILDKSISKLNNLILKDAQESGMKIKRGLIVFSAMRPIHKALEFSSSIFIPGVTGNFNGSLKMLKDIGINVKIPKGWKTLLDLNEEELSRLITSILVKRVSNGHNQDIIGNIYLVKIGNQFWDAREVSTMLNACGRLNYSDSALAFLLESKDARYEIEGVYSKYKHHLIKALTWVEGAKKIEGEKYVIVNAKSSIKDTIIGTVMSIIASSFLYSEGTILVGMAYRPDNKIKISARIVKDRNKENTEINLNKIIGSVIKTIGGEFGGHANASGGLIPQDKEKSFIELIEKELSIRELKIEA